MSKDLLRELPEPILGEHEEWIELYYKAWEIAFKHIFCKEGLASPKYMDEACNDSIIWQWDTCLMVFYCKYAPHIFPGIESLDNFYGTQKRNGYISMAHIVDTGEDAYGERINPPLYSWAEWEYYKVTGNDTRFSKILSILINYDKWIDRNRRRSNGLYWAKDGGFSMDNSPRCNRGSSNGGELCWIDLSAMQALSAYYIAKIAALMRKGSIGAKYERKHFQLKNLINRYMWCKREGFYFDIFSDGNFSNTKTIASFWPILARISDKKKTERLIGHLENPNEFNRPHRIPSLSYDNPNYDRYGGYWLGGVWAPTNYMVARGLKEKGYSKLAREIAQNHIENMNKVYRNFKPHTIWECYSPEVIRPGTSKKEKPNALCRKNFVGWSALGPVNMLIENIIGIEINWPFKEIEWEVSLLEEHGVKNLKVGDEKISLICRKRKKETVIPQIYVESSSAFRLKIKWNGKIKVVNIRQGQTNYNL